MLDDCLFRKCAAWILDMKCFGDSKQASRWGNLEEANL